MSIALPYQYQKKAAEVGPMWLCLRFSLLPLNVLDVRFNDSKAAATHVQQYITHANEASIEASIKPGQNIERALMLKPDIQLFERDIKLETNKLSSLTDWAYRFTPYVHIYDAHTLLLEVGRSLTLFKGLKHLEHLIRQELEQLGLDVEYGLANTPKAAHLLSYQPPTAWTTHIQIDTIKAARLEHLAVENGILNKLQHCGFQYLADVLAIPTHQLGERFGNVLVQYLDQLLGKLADPLSAVTPDDSFTSRVDFSEPIRNRQWIDQQIKRLLKDLIHFIRIRNLVCRAFTWRFYSEKNHVVKSLELHVRSANNDFDTFAMLTELQFETVDMQWEFSSIELFSDSLLEKTQHAEDLFEVNSNQESISQLLDKLSNRLGHQVLYQISAKPEHLPELINHRSVVDTHLHKANASNSDFQDEPLWLLKQAKRLMLKNNRPVYKGRLTLIHGPHRVTSHWWAELHSRDYYIARQTNGRPLWLYFDRKLGHWYLHGLFA